MTRCDESYLYPSVGRGERGCCASESRSHESLDESLWQTEEKWNIKTIEIIGAGVTVRRSRGDGKSQRNGRNYAHIDMSVSARHVLWRQFRRAPCVDRKWDRWSAVFGHLFMIIIAANDNAKTKNKNHKFRSNLNFRFLFVNFSREWPTTDRRLFCAFYSWYRLRLAVDFNGDHVQSSAHHYASRADAKWNPTDRNCNWAPCLWTVTTLCSKRNRRFCQLELRSSHFRNATVDNKCCRRR